MWVHFSRPARQKKKMLTLNVGANIYCVVLNKYPSALSPGDERRKFFAVHQCRTGEKVKSLSMFRQKGERCSRQVPSTRPELPARANSTLCRHCMPVSPIKMKTSHSTRVCSYYEYHLVHNRIIGQLILTAFVLTVLWGTVKKYGALQSRIM